MLVFLPILMPNLNKEAIGLKSDKENKMPSEAVSDGIFYFGARLGFLFALPRIAAGRMMAEKLGAAGILIIIMRIN